MKYRYYDGYESPLVNYCSTAHWKTTFLCLPCGEQVSIHYQHDDYDHLCYKHGCEHNEEVYGRSEA